ncbi:ParB N-terminal domain-containing protein [Comamonas testosteroni]|uniref:ParB N-terminal domain-containing protein n=1 Tax=Comamonas testosteroni TaxID=285 RepID=UPI0005B395A0|nr:ParB N-terminal domain-containing protein [Comamonas testosteroni]
MTAIQQANAISRVSEEGIQRASEALTAAQSRSGALTAVGAALAEANTYQVGAPRKIDPRHVRRGPYANRLHDYFTTEEFADLKRRISESKGNNQAAMVIETDAKTEDNFPIYDIIYGHSRHQACLELTLERIEEKKEPVLYLAQIMRKDTPKAMQAELMKAENAGRSDTTPYEDALFYLNLLNDNVYPTARAIAFSMGENEDMISRAISTVRNADEALIALVADKRNIAMSNLGKANKLKASDPALYKQRLEELTVKASASDSKTLQNTELFKLLFAPTQNAVATTRAQAFLDKDGKEELGEYKKSRSGGLSLKIHKDLKPGALEKIIEIVQKQTA